MKRTKC